MSIDRNTNAGSRSGLALCWHACLQGWRTAHSAAWRTLRLLFAGVVILYFLFGALFLAMRYVVLPNIDRYKPEVEQLASRAVGRPVSIATIHASWRGLRPNLLLNNVAIHNSSGQPALQLPRVSATLSWWSVPTATLRLHSLEISRPDMDIDRDKDGNLYVAGIPIQGSGKSDDAGLDWLLSQREIVIRDGWLRWKDAQRGAPELVLSQVDLVLQSRWLHHQVALRATPPAAFAAPVDIRAEFRRLPFSGRTSDISQWTGSLYADWRDTDLAVWKAYFDYPFEITEGKGSVRAWLNFDRGTVADFTADLTLADTAVRLRKDLQMLQLASAKGRVSAREQSAEPKRSLLSFGTQGHSLALTDFSLETRDGFRLPSTTISAVFVPPRGKEPEQTEIKAASLELHTLANLVEHLPLAADKRQMLVDLAPSGSLKDFSMRWSGAYPAISAYEVKGKVSNLSMKGQPARPARPAEGRQAAQAAVPAIPGFANLTGEVDATDKGGSMQVASTGLAVELPGYFTEPLLTFDRLNTDVKWTIQPASVSGTGKRSAATRADAQGVTPAAQSGAKDHLVMQIASMDFVHEGMEGALSGTYTMPIGPREGKPLGTIDVSGKLSKIEVNKVGRYLPLKTPEKLRDWLTGALLGGQAEDVKLAIKGELADFPFIADAPGAKPKGVFSASGKVVGGILNYSAGAFAPDGKTPLWPMIDAIDGAITIDGGRLTVKADKARSSNIGLSNVEAVIPNLLAKDLMLNVNGTADGALQDFLKFTNLTPVGKWIEHFTEETRSTGNARLALKLELPLHRLREAKVQGGLKFAGNDITLQSMLPPMLQTAGELRFHEKGFELNGVRTNFLGGPVAITGGTQRDGTISVKADGQLSIDGLRKTYTAPAMQRLLQRVNGGTRYNATINVKKNRPEVLVESSMQGVSLDFPAPLRKAASESMPLQFEMTGLFSEDALALRDEIKVSLGTAVSARYLREKATEKNASWRVVSGGIGVNVPAPQPDSGLIANVNVNSLNLDVWRSAVASIVASDGNRDAPRQADAKSDALALEQYIEPEVLAARATELIVMGRKLDNVVVGASHQKNVWQANIDSEQASGYITWNESRSGRGLGRVTARLASLIIPQSAASEVTELFEGKNEATQIPALDLVVEHFELFGKKFGQIELAANNAATPNGREWRITKLNVTNPDGVLKAAGRWAIRNGESVTNLTYALDIADAGKLLERFGFNHVVRGGKGKLDGDLSWKGLPFSFDIPSLSGQMHLEMAAGQFLKVEPGAAKLLGVLSLQSLPRRLSLDFRDIFSEGFAFDGIVGTANIAQGVIKTDNFKMRGVSAVVLIDGTADIAHESQNLHVAVIPEINAGAASVVYGLVVNPVVGLGSFLAQLFLRDPLMRAFTLEYQVTGPWKDPAIQKLERKLGKALEMQPNAGIASQPNS